MKKKTAMLLTVSLLLCLAGCGRENAPESLPDFNSAPSVPAASEDAAPAAPMEPAFPVQPAPEGHPAIGEGDGELLSAKNMQGDVSLVMSGEGCILCPYIIEDMGNGMIMMSSPGPDQLDDPGDWPQITVQYDPGCSFVNATIRFDAEKAAYEGAYTDTTQDSVQRGSWVVIYGEYDEAGVLHAQRIYLIIWDR